MIKRALISVYDKTGITELATELTKQGIEIISTGGTYKLLKENNIEVKSVEEVTGFPEVLNGRVKTLHPDIFGGILSDRSNPVHVSEMKEHSITPIDLVIVNLYPFEKTIADENVKITDAIEQIDIGGVTLIRAAAKNYKDVNVLVSPDQYKEFSDELSSTKNNIPFEFSQRLAQKAFETTSHYDNAISNYFNKLNKDSTHSTHSIHSTHSTHSTHSIHSTHSTHSFDFTNSKELRYGENPHQKAVLIKDNFDEIYEVLHGKELSYNNLLDMDAAYNLISEFKDETAACAIIKHGNPSGVAVAGDLQEAYARAFATDTLSPFGGIIVINKKLDFKTSLDIDKLFSEIVMAPDFENEALELLMKKKNRRLVKFKFTDETKEFRKISGGVLYQDKDNYIVSESDLKFVTDRKASSEEIEDMLFAFKVVKHTKSNAVIFVKDKRTLAIGGGQPSRIDSTKIAVSKAKEFGQDLKDSIAASDAFFPFPDGLIEIAKAGAAAIIQPGGSVKDEDVIKAANEYNLAMACTGIRHFKH